jgi:hypothetical protein
VPKLTTVAARLLLGLLAQLAGEIGEPVQGGIDADQGEIGLDDLQVKFPDVDEDAAPRWFIRTQRGTPASSIPTWRSG